MFLLYLTQHNEMKIRVLLTFIHIPFYSLMVSSSSASFLSSTETVLHHHHHHHHIVHCCVLWWMWVMWLSPGTKETVYCPASVCLISASVSLYLLAVKYQDKQHLQLCAQQSHSVTRPHIWNQWTLSHMCRYNSADIMFVYLLRWSLYSVVDRDWQIHLGSWLSVFYSPSVPPDFVSVIPAAAGSASEEMHWSVLIITFNSV